MFCTKHAISSGTPEWREGIYSVFFEGHHDPEEDGDITDEDLDDKAICPLCWLDEHQVDRSAEARIRALKKRLEASCQEAVEAKAVQSAVSDWIHEQTGHWPEHTRKDGTPLADVFVNMLVEAVNMAARRKLEALRAAEVGL